MNSFYKELYHNPHTNMPNFLSFLKSDIHDTFKEQGTIVFFEIKKMDDVEESCLDLVGNDLMDYITSKCILLQEKNDSNTMYHFGFDTFMMILNHVDKNTAKLSFDQFERHILSYFKTQGMDQVRLYKNFIPYFKQMHTIEEFYAYMLEYVTMDSNENLEFWFKRTLSQFTKNIQHALSNFDKVVDLVLHDDITGLKNHRAIKQYLRNERKEVSTHQTSAILFIDGDNLKKYNTVSYEAGNEMIAKLAKTIQATLRQKDEVFRWLTGDEFICVIDHVNQNEILQLCERVRRNVEEVSQKWLFPVTVSIGVSFWTKELESWTKAIEQAEIATCQAKKMGKNCTVIWNDSLA